MKRATFSIRAPVIRVRGQLWLGFLPLPRWLGTMPALAWRPVTLRIRRLVVAALVLAGGCIVRPLDTHVRRVDSLGGVDAVGDELGAQGWRIVSVAPLGDGAAYIVVLQREAQ